MATMEVSGPSNAVRSEAACRIFLRGASSFLGAPTTNRKRRRTFHHPVIFGLQAAEQHVEEQEEQEEEEQEEEEQGGGGGQFHHHISDLEQFGISNQVRLSLRR